MTTAAAKDGRLWIHYLQAYLFNTHTLLLEEAPKALFDVIHRQGKILESDNWFPVQIDDLKLYIQSAIVNDKKSPTDAHNVIITAWDGINTTAFYCCFTSTSGQPLSVTATLLHRFRHGEIVASQFSCEVSKTISLKSTVRFALSSCYNSSTDRSLPIEYPEQAPGKMAVCIKCVYGRPDPQRMVEWFELQKMHGVSRVLGFQLAVHADSRRVLDYYQEQGFLTMLPFAIPGNVTRNGRSRRGFEYKDRIDEWQFRSDEQVAVFECQERLSGFSYVGVYDMDEVIVPERYNDMHNDTAFLVGFLKYLEKLYPSAGAFQFRIENFVFDWGKSNNESSLSMMQYVKRSKRMGDPKVVHKPERLRWARTHSVKLKKGYFTKRLPRYMANVHHYRTCRANWEKGVCFSLARFEDRQLLRWEKQLEINIRKVPSRVWEPSTSKPNRSLRKYMR
ncbi:uncharacterized protein LOC121379787 [Gigantopelta aegis]|uniref:uncharacterized protein LOC121379787 n=1 Tax=Gigantopelta aegis TaxID=1735272 RepID=UPI001B88AD68|nr:uncharacterized protein LOC121379787 [Gigantopelta aegis]